MYDNFWDSNTGRPKTATTAHPPGFDLPQTVGQPYVFKITSSYHTGPCEAGQWTSLDIDSNNVPTIRNIITNGNQGKISIGDSIWIQPGTKTTLYSSVNNCSASGDKSCEYVMAPVVARIDTHAYNPVLAFACLHIILAKGASEKYIQVEMSANADHCQAANLGGVAPHMECTYHHDWSPSLILLLKLASFQLLHEIFGGQLFVLVTYSTRHES